MEPILEIRQLNSFYRQGGSAFSRGRTVQVLQDFNVTIGRGGGPGADGGIGERQVYPGQVHSGHDGVTRGRLSITPAGRRWCFRTPIPP